MNYKSVEEIILLVKSFEERTLPKEEWTHTAHLIVGLVYCCRYPLEKARILFGEGVYWLNVAYGTPNTETSGYHETLTGFWLKFIWKFLDQYGRGEDLAILAEDLIALFSNPKLPLKFYSREILFSPKARESYVKPDLRGVLANEEKTSRHFQNRTDSFNYSFLNTTARAGGYTAISFS